MPASSTASAPSAQAVRHLGQFQLLRLLAKTSRTMIWHVCDRGSKQELMLVIPRQKPDKEAGLPRWLEGARRAGRVDHPGLLQPLDIGVQEDWPYLAYDRAAGTLLTERMGRQGLPVADLVPGVVTALEGLASAHEAGHAHGDLHAGMLCWPEAGGGFKLLGLGASLPPPEAGNGMMAQRQRAERDVLAAGLVLHHALAGQPALEEADTMAVVARMPPLGREIVRLPFGHIQPVPDPLRAIVNRATDRQERQRYRSARTLARALSGWLRASSDAEAGAMALLLDRLRLVGLLPGMPGGQQRARRLQAMERERVSDLAEIVLEDVGLSFELLRAVNVVTRRVGAVAHNGPILTVRRAITMLGLDGVRRAANALKPWPGPLSEAQAAELTQQLDIGRRAGQVARWIRPAGYDGELVYLLALMQRLGRLVVQYHFPDEALQIRRLMQPAPPVRRGDPEDPGMSEQAAGFAVLGVDLESLGLAVGRWWGFDDSALKMMRRLPLDSPVHPPDNDIARLRLTASCANEIIDAQTGPAQHRAEALQQVQGRYGRLLNLGLQEIGQFAAGIGPAVDTDISRKGQEEGRVEQDRPDGTDGPDGTDRAGVSQAA
jgi:non-specific serine/threonine protein kinase